MSQKVNKPLILVFSAIVTTIIVGASFFSLTTPQNSISIEQKNLQEQNTEESISYYGSEGKDALTLLTESAEVEQNDTGLVVAINGRKAESSKREYWAFYVNTKLAPVGPGEYKTKNTDTIEWKMEKY